MTGKPVARPDAVLAKVSALYTESLATHGPSARAIGWRDEETRARLSHASLVPPRPCLGG